MTLKRLITNVTTELVCNKSHRYKRQVFIDGWAAKEIRRMDNIVWSSSSASPEGSVSRYGYYQGGEDCVHPCAVLVKLWQEEHHQGAQVCEAVVAAAR